MNFKQKNYKVDWKIPQLEEAEKTSELKELFYAKDSNKKEENMQEQMDNVSREKKILRKNQMKC
jgi:hypothetical protein